MRSFLLSILLLPLFSSGQKLSNVQAIDSTIAIIENDNSLTRKVYDTVSYQKEDGGTNWDSAYNHREVFYKNGQIVKIQAWNKYKNWRNDMLAFYQEGKTIRFSKGESFIGMPDYAKLDFQIHYFQDKEIQVLWLTPKPDNVLGVATDTFLQWSYSLLKKSR